ncbi:hypothetical protein QL285_081866 [Trifolium repens]|nr:hypothetical protein QL285_081866 [Trifolium repens]
MIKLIDEDEEIDGKLSTEDEEILCLWVVERGFVRLSVKDVLSTGNPHTHSLYTQLPPPVSDVINSTTFRFNDSIEDAFIWSNNKNGTYTTKSGYNWLLSLRDPISTHNPLHSWSWIWKLQLPKKIKFFFWLACHNSVPTISLLNHRKMSHTATCTRCGTQDESFLHCIRDCEFSHSLWNHIGFNNLEFFSNSDAYDWLKLGATGSQSLLFSAGVWWCWRHRNLVCLNNETWSLSRLSFNIRAMVETFRICFSPVSNDRLVDRHIKWNNNNYSCAILNVDGSCLGSPIRSGFGGIIRNSFGHYLAGFSGFIPETSDILLVELYAIYKGLLLAREMSIDELACYSDSLHYVNLIKAKLHQIQNLIQLNGQSEALLEEEKQAHMEFEEALNRQEVFWKEKANLKWHLEGDRNTKYFHKIAKIKTSSKTITSLQDGDLVLIEPEHISNHVVSFYKNLFCTNLVLQEPLLAEEAIPKLITDDINALLTLLPSIQEIKVVVYALNKDSAPGPDGFGAFFFHHYWDTVKTNLSNAVLQFFTTSWIMPGFNSNIIALLPKVQNATSIDQFRHITMENFKFKVISKIIADRLASVLPSIIFEEQMDFIHGRNIKDCLCIASEVANLLHNKSFGGNLALKIDISKAFDTLEWSFLLKVLHCFGFNEVFCNWIHVILQSAFLSISVNGRAEGYFNCSRGVRQGDPLSPLLFCLAEDVLSRGISILVNSGVLDQIKGTRHFKVPSHTFYADDLMVFCKGKLSGLKELKKLFNNYALQSGQVISTAKSTIYSGSITHGRLNLIVDLLNFKVGALPFNYLGVPIFKGKPKSSYLQPVADKIASKLTAWKASLLSMAGRVQLVKSVIQSMLIYSISVYSWPTGLIKEVEKSIRNFIWSGDVDKRKRWNSAKKKKKNVRDSVSDFNKSRLVHAQIPLILTVALIPLILTHRLPLIPLISPFTHQIPLILLFKIPKSHEVKEQPPSAKPSFFVTYGESSSKKMFK